MPGTPTSVTSCGARSGLDAFERVDERGELAFAADERRPAVLAHVDAEARARLHRFPDGDRLALALRDDGLGVAVVDHLSSRAASAPRRGPRSRARPTAGARPCSRRRRHEPSPLSGRASSETSASPVLTAIRTSTPSSARSPSPGSPAPREPRARGRPPRNQGAEDRDDRVADELLDRPAPALELLSETLVVRAQDGVDVLGVERLGARGEADEVGEEDRDDLALRRGSAMGRV